MRIAIMQPYLFPYIGYFQLMNAVDEFIVYDNIEFTKKGWINRNRILVNGLAAYISFPLKKDSDYLQVKDRYLADNWPEERKKLRNKIAEVYRKAPQFKSAFPVIESAIEFPNNNLFTFALHSLETIKNYLAIQTPIIISSTIDIDHSLKSADKVIAICKKRNAEEYINPIGGTDLYNKEEFLNNGLSLHFLKTGEVHYKQFENEFVPFLSIIDVMMFNSKEEIKNHIENSYKLVDGA
ncbi:MAG TPA: WbqC family protein [Ferruginibacter sp.]|nr:WbqC family protein [Ferruginibacter sp.]